MNGAQSKFGLFILLIIVLSNPFKHRRLFAFPPGDPLQIFLLEYLMEPRSLDDKTVRYFDVPFDLNRDGKNEFIVYISGRDWCGSGGCPMMILERIGESFKVLTNISITRPPIRVLDTSSNGWRDITVWVEGGGIRPGYEAELRFNGRTYPENPTTLPARKLAGPVPGQTVIQSSDSGKPLYE